VPPVVTPEARLSWEPAVLNLHNFFVFCVNFCTHVNIHIHFLRISGIFPMEISNLCFYPMFFPAQGLECQIWNININVSL
jgi:hypothetical protein